MTVIRVARSQINSLNCLSAQIVFHGASNYFSSGRNPQTPARERLKPELPPKRNKELGPFAVELNGCLEPWSFAATMNIFHWILFVLRPKCVLALCKKKTPGVASILLSIKLQRSSRCLSFLVRGQQNCVFCVSSIVFFFGEICNIV